MPDPDVRHGQRELKSGTKGPDGIRFLPGNRGVHEIVVQKIDAPQISQQGRSRRRMSILLDAVEQQLLRGNIVVRSDRRLQVRYFFRSQIQRRRRIGCRRIVRALNPGRRNPGGAEEWSR